MTAGEVNDLLVGQISTPTENNGFDVHNPNFSHPRHRPPPALGGKFRPVPRTGPAFRGE